MKGTSEHSQFIAAAKCSGDINAFNVKKSVNDISSFVSDLPPGNNWKSKTANVIADAGG